LFSLPLPHVWLALVVVVSIVLMLVRARNIPGAYWIAGGVVLLLLFGLESLPDALRAGKWTSTLRCSPFSPPISCCAGDFVGSCRDPSKTTWRYHRLTACHSVAHCVAQRKARRQLLKFPGDRRDRPARRATLIALGRDRYAFLVRISLTGDTRGVSDQLFSSSNFFRRVKPVRLTGNFTPFARMATLLSLAYGSMRATRSRFTM
jgi:hypothetical protein